MRLPAEFRPEECTHPETTMYRMDCVLFTRECPVTESAALVAKLQSSGDHIRKLAEACLARAAAKPSRLAKSTGA